MSSLKKLLFTIFSGLILMSFFSTQVFSACNPNFDYINIYSGSNYLGKFQDGESVYIKPDLQKDSLKLIFHYENSQDNCFVGKSDFIFKFFKNSGNIEATSFSTKPINNGSSFVSEATFDLKTSSELFITNSFTSTFYINSKNNPANIGSILFNIDNEKPIISLSPDIVKKIYSKNDIVNLNYVINDQKSGLDSILINGLGVSKLINFDNKNKSYRGNLKLNLTESNTIFLTATDLLGNKINTNISFIVDSEGPILIDNSNGLKFDKVYTSSGSSQKITIKNLILEDLSFSTLGAPILIADFSSFNPSKLEVLANCIPLPTSNYQCSFPEVEITIPSTKDSLIKFIAKDAKNNINNFNEITKIYVDNQKPQILDFYIKNSRGTKNIVSPLDTKNYVYLRFKDDSIKVGSEKMPQVFENFDLFTIGVKNYLRNGSCQFDTNLQIGTCYYDIGSDFLLYVSNLKNNGTFKVDIMDQYKNVGSSSLDFILDNKLPVIEKVEFLETNSIKTGVLQSSDKVDFKIFVSDENLIGVNGKNFIQADFGLVSVNLGDDIRDGNCVIYNKSTYQCDFTGVTLTNGYKNSTVIFSVSDIAGNVVNSNFSIEIFARGGESPIAFTVYDQNSANLGNKDYLLILNPINRNKILKGDSTTWFEGKIKLINPTDEFKIVNYGLAPQGCFWSTKTSLLEGKSQLYPNDLVIFKKDGDEVFALKNKVLKQSRAATSSLNEAMMNCSISILKRDNTKVYNPQIINFNLKVVFYDLPRGDYLRANALKINQLISDASFLGSWFDSGFKVYEMLRSVCTVVNTGGGVLTTVKSVMNGIQEGLLPEEPVIKASTGGVGAVDAPKGLIEGSAGEIMSLLTDPDGFVYKACSYVTCSNGGLISMGDIPIIKDLVDIQSNIAGNLCGKKSSDELTKPVSSS